MRFVNIRKCPEIFIRLLSQQFILLNYFLILFININRSINFEPILKYKLSQINSMMRPFPMEPKEHVRMSVPTNTQWPLIKKLQQNIIKFPYTQYPFPNQPVPADLFNTMVQCNINQRKIQKIVNFKCENIINLKKIVKIKMKDKTSSPSQKSQKSKQIASTYSFYYEKVQYSLGHVLQLKSKEDAPHVNKFNLNRAQIKKSLANVIALLYKEGIISFLEFHHIGITQQGVIKVFIAPHVLFDQSQYNPKTRVLVINYLNQVLKQIDAKFPKFTKYKKPIERLNSHPQLSIEKDIIDSQESFFIGHPQDKKNINEFNSKTKGNKLLENLQKSFSQDGDNFFLASGSTNLDHLKIHKQMRKKFQNHKLASKAEQNMKSERKNRILTKQQQQQKISELTHQLQQIRMKVRQKLQQKRWKNIHTSRGFRTMETQDKTQNRQPNNYNQKRYEQRFNQNKQKLNPRQFQDKLKDINRMRKTSTGSINFYNGVIPHQKNINCINIYHPQDRNSRGYYRGGEDAMSVDTYQMEIGDDYQMPKINVSLGMRKSLSPNKARESLKVTSQSKKTDNDPSKMRFCESAGGKSFDHIMNLLKPQFQPKKSNIFEEPQIQNEQDSKTSISLKKSFKKLPSEHSSIEKQKYLSSNQRILSPSYKKVEKQPKQIPTVVKLNNDLNNILSHKIENNDPSVTPKKLSIKKRKTLPIQRNTSKNPQLQMMDSRHTQYESKNKQKTSHVFVKKAALQQKVKIAMERTKNAINVLNKAKIRQISSAHKIERVNI